MTWMTLGALALPHMLQRHSVSLRKAMSQQSVEMTTGQSHSPRTHLKGNLNELSAIRARTDRLEALIEGTRQRQAFVAAGQTALTRLADAAQGTSAGLLAVSTVGVDEAAVTTVARGARAALDDAVAALSAQFAGRALFSGTAVDRPPLISSDAIMARVGVDVVGATSAAQVAAIVDGLFLDVGGVFETELYQGTPNGLAVIGDDQAASLAMPTAANPGLRRMLAGLVKAALIAENAPPLSATQRQALARDAALTLSSAGAEIVTEQGRLGQAEARLDSAVLRYTGEREALALARDSLIGVDPFEAAGRLQDTQTRLELVYAVTARTARLNLTGYL